MGPRAPDTAARRHVLSGAMAAGSAPGTVLTQCWLPLTGGRSPCGTPVHAQEKEESVGLLSTPRPASAEPELQLARVPFPPPGQEGAQPRVAANSKTGSVGLGGLPKAP